VTPVELLRELVRVRSVNPPGDEDAAVEVLEPYLAEAGLETQVLRSPSGRPSLVATVRGDPEQPALVLLSHLDVVPVEESRWSHDPFGAEIVDGELWGRGTLDMKGIAVMHAVAAAELARSGQTPSRDVVVVAVADEEAGGGQGAQWLLDEHPEAVGFANCRPPPEVIGEGGYGLRGVLPRPVVPIVLGEKTAVWIEVVAEGEAGHGGMPPLRQAPVALARFVDDVAGFGTPRLHPVLRELVATVAASAAGPLAVGLRALLATPVGGVLARAAAPEARKRSAIGLLLSDSITPTSMSAGYSSNVVPGEAHVSFDCRLLPDTDPDDFVETMRAKAERHGCRVTDVRHGGSGPVSQPGPLFDVLRRASLELEDGVVATASLTPGITDLRFFRAKGATGYGWCPLLLTSEQLATVHGADERVVVEDFERAVRVTAAVVAEATGAT
jgi:acetylornithine deacetylase/succinyl-diaminopimelate desuccinylase-like protein